MKKNLLAEVACLLAVTNLDEPKFNINLLPIVLADK